MTWLFLLKDHSNCYLFSNCFRRSSKLNMVFLFMCFILTMLANMFKKTSKNSMLQMILSIKLLVLTASHPITKWCCKTQKFILFLFLPCIFGRMCFFHVLDPRHDKLVSSNIQISFPWVIPELKKGIMLSSIHSFKSLLMLMLLLFRVPHLFSQG